MPESLDGAAPAKINLALHVTGRRADGYHLLETLVVFTRFGDRLGASAAGEDSLRVSGPFAGQVPPGADNLVLRARDLMRRHFGAAAGAAVALALEKNLPAAAGIGGGSSDAAAAIRLLARLWGIEARQEELEAIAGKLGADVPMCLAAVPLLATGIGEALRPLAHFPALPVLLVNPGLALSTPEVFSRLSSRENPPLPALGGFESVAEVAGWLGGARNDLEAAALMLAPEIGAVLAALREEGAVLARMSGSGATCFGLFGSGKEAARAGKAIAMRRPEWFVQATTTMPAGEAADHG